MSVNEAIAQRAMIELKELWGGRLPTWEEFKEASTNGRVRVNKTIAAQAIYSPGVPALFRLLYGIVLPWVALLSVPLAIVGWVFFDFRGWVVGGSVLGAWFLFKVVREGHCEGVKAGAEKYENFYYALATSGAFLFKPK